MKRNYTLSRGSFLLFILISLIAVVSCNTSGSANPDGWYLTDDGIETKGSPIATIQDFAYLKIDTLNMNGTIYYELQSQMKPEAMQKFAEYTEKTSEKYWDLFIMKRSSSGLLFINALMMEKWPSHRPFYRKIKKK